MIFMMKEFIYRLGKSKEDCDLFRTAKFEPIKASYNWLSWVLGS
jgi:hypothetical protein